MQQKFLGRRQNPLCLPFATMDDGRFDFRTYAGRLAWGMARAQLGQSDLVRRAKAIGVPLSQQAISHLLKPEAKKSGHTPTIAAILGLNPVWLATGQGPKLLNGKHNISQVVGYVGAGGEVFPVDDHAMGAGLEEVPAPIGYEGICVAVRVRGNSMYPQMEDGWLIFYAKNSDGVPDDAIGRLCVVRVADTGQMLVKKVKMGRRKGCFRLESVNAPTMEDVRLEWAARIIDIRPD